jgi:hypothetical protein
VSDDNAEGKQPGSMKQGNTGGADVIGTDRNWPAVDLFSFHQARI